MKLCKDCKWLAELLSIQTQGRKEVFLNVCFNPKNIDVIRKKGLRTGIRTDFTIIRGVLDIRWNENKKHCGYKARWFEPKEVPNVSETSK